ncbi:TonB-dependent receptor [Sphingomonas sp. H39-1-10]|uniref:TonB-dependent receptor n=1 Tax=Sphingomonas pollutisoli TaxID=3030829 RepID=UPI0023B978FF|nr:TonB-dependent receptor [Sphingomonas pollutisoli]MDF0488915.1 TonB-dependent receptor [Sphingomonas pollutisoli]
MKFRTTARLLLLSSAFAIPALAHAQAQESTAADADAPGRETIIVKGSRQKGSLEQEQLASPNAVAELSAAKIEQAPDVNLAESLARLPGVSVFNGGQGNTNSVATDIAGRGQGNYVALRGMDAEYNINLINGVEGAQGMPFSRQVPLNLLPPSGMHRIVVNKTFLPGLDGTAIGGSIDFRTPTAADFDRPTVFNVSVTGRLASRARDYKQDADGETATAEFAKTFGASKQFGFYVSGYYDRTNFTNSIVDGVYPAATNGQWTYALQNVDGTSAAPGSRADNLTSLGVNAGFTNGLITRYGGSASLDWAPDESQHWYIRGTYARNDIAQDSYYEQIYADSTSRTQIGTTGTYATNITQLRPRYYFSTSPEQALLATAQLGGDLKFGKLTLRPNAFFSAGEYNAPDHQEISARKPNSGSSLPYSGTTMFTYRDGQPILIGSAAQYAFFDGIANYNARRAGELSAEFSHQTKWGLKLDGDIDVDAGVFKTISFGAKYRDAYRKHTYNDYSSNRVFDAAGHEVSWSTLNIFDGSVSQVVPGLYNFSAPLINRSALDRLFNADIAQNYGTLADADDSCSDPGSVAGNINNHNCNTQSGHERVTSGYAMATFGVGIGQVLVGARYEHTDITNVYWTLPTDGAGNEIIGTFASSKTTYDKLLPSLQVNLRPSERLALRMSVSRTYMPPSFFQLAGGQRISKSGGGAEAGGTTSITQGNPDLKAMESTNFDASVEFANNTTALSVSAFYKALDNFFYSQVNNYANVSTETGATTISKPVNGGSGNVYGVELAGSVTIEAAPALPGSLVLSGNATFEGSRVDPKGGLSPNERLLYQPDLTANAQVSYLVGGLRADLSYRYTSDYVYQYAVIGGSSDLDGWVHARSQLDLHVAYAFGPAKLEGAISNLSNERSYYATIGRSSSTIGAIVDSGRTFTLKTSYQF